MAQVYLARDVRLGREVALKVLDQRLGARPGFRERFLREARVAASLDHPNIVPLYDFGEADRQLLYLVMPFVSGGSLQDRLKEAPFPVGEVATFGSQIADALEYAHQRGVVHRDVKPANMLLHADGRLLLSDFGLAKILSSARPATPRNHPDAGTPEYMAPEQINGGSDERSDIYALGVVLYLLLTGRLPFSGSTSAKVMERHLYRLPAEPRRLNPNITPAMQGVVLRALAKHPEDRFQRASELGGALLGALVAGDAEPLPYTLGGSNPDGSAPSLTPYGSYGSTMSGWTSWEPPLLSSQPRSAHPSLDGLPQLDEESLGRITRRLPGQSSITSRFSGFGSSRASYGPSQMSSRIPVVSLPASSPRPITMPPGSATSSPLRMSAPPMTSSISGPIPILLGSPVEEDRAVESPGRSRMWVVVIVFLLLVLVAAGVLLFWVQQQPILPSHTTLNGAQGSTLASMAARLVAR
jgi:serine/threonine protein kinase